MNSVQFVKKSNNAKTGAIPVTTSARQTCPAACPFNNGNGCYAEAGFYTRLNWDKVSSGERGSNYADFLDNVKALPDGQLWRHNVAGDLQGEDDTIDYGALVDLAIANRGKRGFTYTHYPMTNEDNVTAVEAAIVGGFTVNISCNSIEHAVETKQALPHLPVVAVAPSDYGTKTRIQDGVKFVTCPATYKDDVTCASCKLCSVVNRDSVVVFPAHGTQTKQADIIARG